MSFSCNLLVSHPFPMILQRWSNIILQSHSLGLQVLSDQGLDTFKGVKDACLFPRGFQTSIFQITYVLVFLVWRSDSSLLEVKKKKGDTWLEQWDFTVSLCHVLLSFLLYFSSLIVSLFHEPNAFRVSVPLHLYLILSSAFHIVYFSKDILWKCRQPCDFSSWSHLFGPN